MWSFSAVNSLISAIVIGTVVSGIFAKPPRPVTEGEFAAPDEFPGVVRLDLFTQNYTVHCGGAIISHRHILTAGHCLEGVTSAKVYGGTIIRNDPNAVVRDTVDIIRHPNYNFERIGEVDVITNDIGILVVNRDLDLGIRLKFLLLPKNQPKANTHAIFAGWGQISNSSLELTPLLKKIDVVLLPDTGCSLSHMPEKYCGQTAGAGTCPGDSGSPLVNSGGQIIGLLSTSICIHDYAQVYTNVYHHLPWINSILNNVHIK